MESLSTLLFELANIDRLDILSELNGAPMKLTNVSKKLDLTVQETSRHLQRLCDALLVKKKADGAYHITPHGSNILSLLPGLAFLNEHREYFLNHRIDHLPREFIYRIGALQGSRLIDSPVLSFQRVNTIIEESEEYLYMTADQAPSGSVPLIEAAVKRGVNLCTLMPESMVRPDLPDAYQPHYDQSDMERILLGWTQSIAFVGVISKKSAVVGFPSIDGKMDYLSFNAEDDLALQWCKDLFLHYWHQVEPVHPPQG